MVPTVDCRLDGHVHTRLCRHAQGEMEDYVRAAIARGLNTLIFLEHFEVGICYPHRIWLTDADFAFYFEEGERLRRRYRNRITLCFGAEVGWNPRASQELLDRLSRFPWEHIGLSCHFFWDGSRHLNLLTRRPEQIALLAQQDSDQILTWYLDSLYAGIQAVPCDVLCHLDAPLRYVPHVNWSASHQAQIDRILAVVRDKGISLEINTSGYAIRGQPFPRPAFLQQAHRLGIPFICGSDAHRPDQVGRYFDQVDALLQSFPE